MHEEPKHSKRYYFLRWLFFVSSLFYITGHTLTITIIIVIIIRYELDLDGPVSGSSNSLFKGLPSRLRTCVR